MKSKDLWEGSITLDTLSDNFLNLFDECSNQISKESLNASKKASTFDDNEIDNILDEMEKKNFNKYYSQEINLIENNLINNFEKTLGSLFINFVKY